MKDLLLALVGIVAFGGLVAFTLGYEKAFEEHGYDLEAGDLVFQSTNGSQGLAVQAATDSPWSHVGVVVMDPEGKASVLEANGPVAIVPLNTFRARSDGEFLTLRSEEGLPVDAQEKIASFAKDVKGVPYDSLFQWSDDELYCSELVWKLYERAFGIELCSQKTFDDFNLDHPKVLPLVIKRYGSRANLPPGELVVAPSDLAESGLLAEVPKAR